MDTINKLNQLMVDFYKAWEFENTQEQFLSLNGELHTTQEMKINIERFQSMTDEIEELINNEENYGSITENWDAIDQTMLETLFRSFEIDIETFASKVKNDSEVRNEIVEFFE